MPKSYSDHTMAGTEPPCLGIAGDRRVAHVHHGVLDIGVPQPVLHKGDIRAGVCIGSLSLCDSNSRTNGLALWLKIQDWGEL